MRLSRRRERPYSSSGRVVRPRRGRAQNEVVDAYDSAYDGQRTRRDQAERRSPEVVLRRQNLRLSVDTVRYEELTHRTCDERDVEGRPSTPCDDDGRERDGDQENAGGDGGKRRVLVPSDGIRHDRNRACRVLRLPSFRNRYTGRWHSTGTGIVG